MRNTNKLIFIDRDRKRRQRRRNIQKFFKGFEDVAVQLVFIAVIGLSVLLHLQAVGF